MLTKLQPNKLILYLYFIAISIAMHAQNIDELEFRICQSNLLNKNFLVACYISSNTDTIRINEKMFNKQNIRYADEISFHILTNTRKLYSADFSFSKFNIKSKVIEICIEFNSQRNRTDVFFTFDNSKGVAVFSKHIKLSRKEFKKIMRDLSSHSSP